MDVAEMSVNPDLRQESEPPSPECLELAAKELRETPDVVGPALQELRAIIAKDGTLNFREDDEILVMFLRPCKYYAKSAYELMTRVADFKTKHFACIGNLMPDDEKSAWIDHKIVNVLQNRDQHGRRVLVANLGSSWDTKSISGEQVFKLFYLVHILAMGEPETQIRGAVVILDFDGLGMKQVAQLTPSFSMRLLTFIQEAMPLRLKEVHIVRQPFIFNIVWKVFSPFIKQKLAGRIHFHGSKFKELHNFMGKSELPADYDGDRPKISYSSKDWYPTLKGCENQIEEWNTWGSK